MYHFVWDQNQQLSLEEKEARVDLPREKSRMVWILLSVGAIPLFCVAAQYLIFYAVRWLFPSLLREGWFSLLLGSVTMYLIAMPAAYLLLRRAPACAPSKGKLPLRALPMLLSTALALTTAGSMISNVINQAIALFSEEGVTNPVESATANTPMWANVLCLVILAPIFEELFFRKFLIDRLRPYGDLTAILISALVFGLIHGNFSQVFYAAFVGVLLGGVYCKTGKLRHTVAIHMFLNFFGGIFVLLIRNACGNELPQTLTTELFAEHPLGAALLCLYYAVTLTALGAAAPSIIYLLRRKKLEKGTVPFKKEIRRAVLLANPAFWIALTVMVVYFFI